MAISTDGAHSAQAHAHPHSPIFALKRSTSRVSFPIVSFCADIVFVCSSSSDFISARLPRTSPPPVPLLPPLPCAASAGALGAAVVPDDAPNVVDGNCSASGSARLCANGSRCAAICELVDVEAAARSRLDGAKSSGFEDEGMGERGSPRLRVGACCCDGGGGCVVVVVVGWEGRSMGLATSSKEEESLSLSSSGESSSYLEARSLMLAVWAVIEGGGPLDRAEVVGVG